MQHFACRSQAIFEWQMLNLTLGLDALGPSNLTSEANLDAFQGLQSLEVLDVLSGKWADELDATIWSWAHLYPQCQHTDEVIAIQV